MKLGRWSVALMVLAVAAVALGALYVHSLWSGSTAGSVISPETAVRPGYTATYNYTVSVYLGQEQLVASYNEFRVQVASVDGDKVYFYYQPLISYNATASNQRRTLNYTYALVPSNLTTYYEGFGMPLFLSQLAAPGSGGANTTLDGYNVTYKYVATRSGGYLLVSSTLAIYNGTSPVSAQYWYYQYNYTTDVLKSSTGLLITPTYAYRFEYQLVDFEVS